MFIHDVIKIRYVKEGYLPNYPYHLISDEEMFHAFLDMKNLKYRQWQASGLIGNNDLDADDLMEQTLGITWRYRTDSEMYEEYTKAGYDVEGMTGAELFWDDIPNATYKLYFDNDDTYAVAPDGYIFEDHPLPRASVGMYQSHYIIVAAYVDGEEVARGSVFVWVDDTYEDDCYFVNNYPCIDEILREDYNKLAYAIQFHINTYLQSLQTSEIIPIPDWVYSYMLGEVVCNNSDQLDRHDLLVLLNLDNIEDEITLEIHQACLRTSSEWIKRLPEEIKEHRPPTMFGEPHIIKSLRMRS